MWNYNSVNLCNRCSDVTFSRFAYGASSRPQTLEKHKCHWYSPARHRGNRNLAECSFNESLKRLMIFRGHNQSPVMKALQSTGVRGHTERTLVFWVQTPNQRVTAGDNCVWAINTIKENRTFLTCSPSPSAAPAGTQTDSRHLKTPTKPQGTYFSQTARLSKNKKK